MKALISRVSAMSDNALAWTMTLASLLLFCLFVSWMVPATQAPVPQTQVSPETRNLFQRRVWLEARIKVCAGKTEPTPACKQDDIKNMANYKKELSDLEMKSK